MTSPAFFAESAGRRLPQVRLVPLRAYLFAALADRPLRDLLQVYGEAATEGVPRQSDLSAERLFACGMRARVQNVQQLYDQPAAVMRALGRAAAGPRLTGRPVHYRLETAAGERLVALLPLAEAPGLGRPSDQQREVVEVLAAFGV